MWKVSIVLYLGLNAGLFATYMCPITWFETSYGCIKLHEVPKTWIQAEAECRKEGGYLANVQTSERHEILKNLLHQHGDHGYHWLGATDYFVEGTFMWINNGQLVKQGYTAWLSASYPTNSSDRNCLIISEPSHHYRIWDRNCNDTHRSICERPLNASSYNEIVG